MKQWQVLKTIFPEVITDNFEFVDFQESTDWTTGLMSAAFYRARIIRRALSGNTAFPKSVWFRISYTREGGLSSLQAPQMAKHRGWKHLFLRLRSCGRRLSPDPWVRGFLKEEDWVDSGEHPLDSGRQTREPNHPMPKSKPSGVNSAA